MAAGGHGARDGGKTRGALLRRSAQIAYRDLNDVDQAFTWLADALVSHVDVSTLDALEALGLEVADPRRAEGAITHSLNEVFDGPLVRQLLARRAKIRRDQIVDHQGAAQDLKKLHDLSPNDGAVMEELAGLLTDLGDFKTLVQVYEDQILRGKDMSVRAELARKVARISEEQLADAREAADAWRRVLRMKQGDTEATAGLERAKTNALKKPDPATLREAYAPPKIEPKPEAPKQDVVKPEPKPDAKKSVPGMAAATPAAGANAASPNAVGPMRSRTPSGPPQKPLAPRAPSDAPPATAKPRSEPPPLPPEARMPSSLPPTHSPESMEANGAAAFDSPADDEPNTAMTNVAGAVGAGDLEMEIDASLGRLDGVGDGEDVAPTGAPPPPAKKASGRKSNNARDAVDTASMHREPMHTIESDALSSGPGGPHTLPGMGGDNAGTIPPEDPSREELDLDDVDLVEHASGDPMESTESRPLTRGEEDAASADTPFEGNPHRREDDDEHTETGQTQRPLR
jgi:hypothetical protein